MQCDTVHYKTIQNAAQCGALQYSTVQHNGMLSYNLELNQYHLMIGLCVPEVQQNAYAKCYRRSLVNYVL